MIDFKHYIPETNKYIKHYFLLIEKRLADPATENFHKHHILPSSMFSEFKSEPSNIVRLAYREHFIAHMLLWLGTKNTKMLWAARVLSNSFSINSKTYDLLISQLRCSVGPNQDRITVTDGADMRFINPEEYDHYKLKGWYRGNLLTGRKPMKRDGATKYVHPDEVQTMQNNGWEFGNENALGRVLINNGIELKRVLSSEVESHLSNGWRLGYHERLRFLTKDGVNTRVYESEYSERLADGWVDFSPSNKGTICVSKDDEYKYILPSEAEYFLKDGWTARNFLTDTRSIQKDGIIKYISQDDFDSYIAEGWTSYSPATGKITVIKGDVVEFIQECDLQRYEADGWIKGNKSSGKVNVIKNGVNKQINPDELQTFLSDGWAQGNFSSGTVTIHKSGEFIQVKKDELDEYLSSGWDRKTPSSGRKYMNNGKINKQVIPEEYQYHLDNGWVKGFVKKTKQLKDTHSLFSV